MTLKELVIKHKAHKPDFYLGVYEELFTPIRNCGLSLLEIGIWEGGSLRAWAEYFPNASINGIDLNIPKGYFDSRVKMFKGDQTDAKFLGQVVKEEGPFNIIIDDASHLPCDWMNSYLTLFPTLIPGGYYIIEDLMAVVRPECCRDPRQSRFIEPCLTEMCRPLLAQINNVNGLAWIKLFPHLFVAKKWGDGK